MEEPEESLVEIDEFSLDREWLKQPKLVMKFSLALADAKKEMLKRKAHLDLVEAELELEIRKNPEAYEITKQTEAVIKATVITQEKYQHVQQKYIQIRHKVDVLSGALEALQHRKKALEDLVVLHCASYYAEPRSSTEGRDALTTATKRNVRKKGVRR